MPETTQTNNNSNNNLNRFERKWLWVLISSVFTRGLDAALIMLIDFCVWSAFIQPKFSMDGMYPYLLYIYSNQKSVYTVSVATKRSTLCVCVCDFYSSLFFCWSKPSQWRTSNVAELSTSQNKIMICMGMASASVAKRTTHFAFIQSNIFLVSNIIIRFLPNFQITPVTTRKSSLKCCYSRIQHRIMQKRVFVNGQGNGC